jgi:hypothetical protein
MLRINERTFHYLIQFRKLLKKATSVLLPEKIEYDTEKIYERKNFSVTYSELYLGIKLQLRSFIPHSIEYA